MLFTGGGGAGSEALSRLLGDHYEVHFADADAEARPHSIDPACWHSIPMAVAPDFLPGLRHLCRELRVDLLVPGVDEELLPVAEARDTFDCGVLLPAAEFVRSHLDKLTSSRLLASSGVPAPLTELVTQRNKVDFPCIVKPRQGRGSRGVAIVRSEPELQAHLVTSRRPAEEFIVQALLPGQEYTVMMAADRAGRLRAVVPVKVGIKRGITLRARTDRDDAVIRACVAIHASYPVAGCYNIQLMRDTTGAALPFEINPRISTTSCLGIAAGVDFLSVYLDSTQEDSGPTRLTDFRDGLGLKRSWHNEFLE